MSGSESTKDPSYQVSERPQLSLTNHRNFDYNILKYLKDEMVKDKEISDLELCSECTNDILTLPLKTFTVLSCEHLFHRLCIEKKLMIIRPDVCQFSDCGKKVDIIYPVFTFARRGSHLFQSSGTSALSNWISEKTRSSSASSTNASIDFLKLYKDILDAEDASKKMAQDLIFRYFHFGKALKDQYNFFRKFNPKRTSQGLVNNEVRKQIPISVSESLLRKTKKRVQKIYDMFSELRIDKIKWIKTFTVSTLTYISQKDIDYVLAMLSSL
ncbi:5107_t:CDS:2 [Funneliformis geosporum]|nr:5107_t:CDS:2 [Funneliformis geosporum]